MSRPIRFRLLKSRLTLARLAPALLAPALLATALLAACSTPAVMKEKAMLKPSEIADMGLVCRDMPPVDSIRERTICATPAAWSEFDRKERLIVEDVYAQSRNLPNARRFGGPGS